MSHQHLIETLRQALPGTRGDGPVYMHSVRVYESLLEHGCSEEVCIAGLFHDMIEDAAYTDQMLADLGCTEYTRELIGYVSHDSAIEDKAERWDDMMHRCVAAQNADVRAIKIADFSDNIANTTGCSEKRLEAMIVKRAPLFIYYGNKFLSGSELYATMLERYWRVVMQMQGYQGM